MAAISRKTIDRIPPTSSALKQHTKRAAYQAGHIWGTSLVKMQNPPAVTDWGWKIEDSAIFPVWSDLPEVSKACRELIRCKCKKNCSSGRCTCKKGRLPCTELCSCSGTCYEPEPMDTEAAAGSDEDDMDIE